MSIFLDAIELPEDLLWSDETTSWKVGQTVATTLTGARIIQESALQAGRPITLESQQNGSDYVAVVPRSVVDALLAKEAIAGAAPMTLSLPVFEDEPRTFQVLWRRTDGPAIESRPISFKAPIAPSDFFYITLRLMQV